MIAAREKALCRCRSLLRLADPERNSSAGERANAKRAAKRLIKKWKFKNSELAGDEVDGELIAQTNVEEPLAYCGRCSKLVNFNGTRCRICRKNIWELVSAINGAPVRTSTATYRNLVRHCNYDPVRRLAQ